MTPFRISLRSIICYWRSNTALVLSVAAAVSVITGSLLVGGSIRSAFRLRVLDRLGNINYALAARGTYFRESLAQDLGKETQGGDNSLHVPLIYLQGSIQDPDSGITAPQVTVLGVGKGFWDLFPGSKQVSLDGRSAVLNRALADDLGISQGAPLILNIPRYGPVSGGTLFGKRKREDVISSFRITAQEIIPDKGPGLFSLSNDILLPRTLFISLEWLQKRAEKKEKANLILISSGTTIDTIRNSLRQNALIEDYGFKVISYPDKGYLSFESGAIVISDPVIKAVREAGARNTMAVCNTSIYLLNKMEKDGKYIPYSIVAGMELHSESPFGPLPLKRGDLKLVNDNDIILNEWAANELDAGVNDRITAAYFEPVKMGDLKTASMEFLVKGIISLQGKAHDPHFVPEYEGITDADAINNWDVPFEVDMSLIREKDENYWDIYKATPKAFVSLNTLKNLWEMKRDEGGYITSIRLAPSNSADLDKNRTNFIKEFLSKLNPEHSGILLLPVRDKALQAALGSTDDYGILFISMSIFLIVSSLGLIGLLFRLLVERRMKQNGILLAAGLPAGVVSRILLFEGTIVALAGSVIGLPLGIAYTDFLINGFKQWGIGSLIPIDIKVHADIVNMIVGMGLGLIAAISVMWLSIRKVSRIPVISLLSGQRAFDLPDSDTMRKSLARNSILFGIAALVLLGAGLTGLVPPAALFFSGGAILLVLGILFLKSLFAFHGSFSLFGFSLNSLSRNKGRSILIVTLIACACFIIVAVAVNIKDFSDHDMTRADSGSGGFSFRLTSDMPVLHDIGTEKGRNELGFTDTADDTWGDIEFIPFRISSGEDVSCLNLQKPTQPRMLGVTEEMINRGGFSFQKLMDSDSEYKNPWKHLLTTEFPDNVIPAFGDANSLQWILHKKVGDTIEMVNKQGQNVFLKIVGSLSGSIFQGELLISEKQFDKHFGRNDGYRYFLVSAPAEKTGILKEMLQKNMAEFGCTVHSTSELLSAFAKVQNVYIVTFLMLGSLGFLLGTFGLAAVLLRNVIERKGEYGLMLAVGFKKSALIAMSLFENGALIVTGMVVGGISSLIAVIPYMISSHSNIKIGLLLLMLTAVLAAGLVSCFIAAALSMRGNFISALRRE